MKIITKDYDSGNIVPSWCVREVWKTHALCDAKQYEADCKGLCGNVIKYQIWVKPDPEGEVCMNEEFTENVYKIRFNRSPPKPIWSFNFNPQWKNEYQTEKDLKYSKRVKENKQDASQQNKNESADEKEIETSKSATSLSVGSFYSTTKTSGATASVHSNLTPIASSSLPEPSDDAGPSRALTRSSAPCSLSDVPGPSNSGSNRTIENLPTSSVSTPRRLRSSGTAEETNSSESRGSAAIGSGNGVSSSSPSSSQPVGGHHHRCVKRPSLVTRNSVMTRARTKMLKIDV